MQIDRTSRRLIEMLQRDGRLPYSVLAQEVGLSEAAVRQRVLKLIEEGVMQIVAVTDPLQLGYGREAMLGINVVGDPRIVAKHLADVEEVSYVVHVGGRWDLVAEVVAVTDDDLLDLISDRIRAIEGISSIETSIYLRLEKQTYTWGAHRP